MQPTSCAHRLQTKLFLRSTQQPVRVVPCHLRPFEPIHRRLRVFSMNRESSSANISRSQIIVQRSWREELLLQRLAARITKLSQSFCTWFSCLQPPSTPDLLRSHTNDLRKEPSRFCSFKTLTLHFSDSPSKPLRCPLSLASSFREFACQS